MIDYLSILSIGILLVTSIVLLALHRVLPGFIATCLGSAASALSFVITLALFLPLQNGVVTLPLYNWSPLPYLTVPFIIKVDLLSYVLSALLLAMFTVVMVWMVISKNRLIWNASEQQPFSGTLAEPQPEAQADSQPLTPGPIENDSAQNDSGHILVIATMLLLAAVILAVLFAGNTLMFCLAWLISSLPVFMLRCIMARQINDILAGRNLLIVEQLAGCCALGATVLAIQQVPNASLLTPTQTLPAPAYFIPLMLVPAFVRLLQYPFSRLIECLEQDTPAIQNLIQVAFLAIPGAYLLFRLSSLANLVGATYLSAVLVIFGLLTTLFGLLQIRREAQLTKLASGLSLVHIGLAVMAVGIGSFAALAAGLFLILIHVISKVALGLALGSTNPPQPAFNEPGETQYYSQASSSQGQPALPERNLAVGISLASLIGLAPFAIFWAYWLLANVALGARHIELWILVLISLGLVTQRGLATLDGFLIAPQFSDATPRAEKNQTNRSIVFIIPIALSAIVAVLPATILGFVVQPVISELGQSGFPSAGIAIGGTDVAGGWLAIVNLCILLSITWLIWLAGPMPLTVSKRLGIESNSVWGFRLVFLSQLLRLLFSPRLHESRTLRIANHPAVMGKRLWAAVHRLGCGMGNVAEAVEERYFAPAVAVTIVLVLFLFLG